MKNGNNTNIKTVRKNKRGDIMELLIDNRQVEMEIDQAMEDMIRRVIEKSLEVERNDLNYEISLSFVNNEEIRVLNRDFRGKDSATDVLSFPMEDEIGYGDLKVLGDIVISLERALEQSVEYGHTFEREVGFLVCHSMFHLMGYDHDTPENTKEMRAKEENVLKLLGIDRKSQ